MNAFKDANHLFQDYGLSLYDVELNKERNRYGKVQVAGDVGCSSYRQA